MNRMNQTPDWTLDEFKILLASGGKPSAELVSLFPNRTVGAVSAVQQGIHAFHVGHDHSILSKLMVDYLEDQRGCLTCPVCGRLF